MENRPKPFESIHAPGFGFAARQRRAGFCLKGSKHEVGFGRRQYGFLRSPVEAHRPARLAKGSISMTKRQPETSTIVLAASPVLGQMIGSDKATALGLTVRGPSPVLALCRALVAAGVDPNRPLHAYRGDCFASSFAR
jgi:hypothetical protein